MPPACPAPSLPDPGDLPDVECQAGGMAEEPVSAQLYSVRDAVQQDLPAALDRLASIGFRAVELYGFVDRAGDYASALLPAGLTAPSAHAPLLSAEDPDRI